MANEHTTSGIWRAIDVVCDTPTLLVLEAIWLGERRFSEFERSTGLQKTLISARLKFLLEEQVLEKRALSGQGRTQGYFLRPKGLGLFPVAVLMLNWEQKWGQNPHAPDVEILHLSCGHKLGAIVTCHNCHEEVKPADITATKGPDFYVGANAFVKRRRQAGLARSSVRLFDEIADILGDRWMALILRMALMGVSRFDAFETYTGIAPNILSDRLARAIKAGIMTAFQYQENPPRQEYLLTEKAFDLQPIILLLTQWGADWFDQRKQQHAYLAHSCGVELHPQMRCGHCRDLVTIDTAQLKITAAE